MRRAVTACVAAIIVVLSAPRPAQASPASVEQQLLSLINEGRLATNLLMHQGLRSVARVHSQDMDKADGLNHHGAAGRFDRASPDPRETNGAPDDGFTGLWCENVAWVGGGEEKDVAKRMYDGWVASPPHDGCMNNLLMTVAGLGVYSRNGEWWATLEASQDLTLPGLGDPPAGEAAPTEPPVVATPDVTSTPHATTVPERRSEVTVAAKTPPVPDPTAAAVAGPRKRPAFAAPFRPPPNNPGPDWLEFTAAGAVLAGMSAAWITSRGRRIGNVFAH